MNERLDAILSEYEELWRAAAVEGRAQFRSFVGGGGPDIVTEPGTGLAACAVSIMQLANPALKEEGDFLRLDGGACGIGDCTYRRSHLGMYLVHLNNAHRWTWDMLANKTRDALAQGMTR